MTTSVVLGIPYIATAQSQPDVTHNEALNLLQMILAGGVIAIGNNTPPVSPSEGDTYIVGTSPTGAWAGRPNTIAGFFFSVWIFLPGDDSSGTAISMGADQEGLRVWSKVDNAIFVWTDLGASPGVFSWRVDPGSISQLALLDDTNIVTPQDCDHLVFVDGLWQNRFSNTTFFSKESELPAPSGGVITLVTGKNYYLTKAFSMANRLIFGEKTSLTSNSLNSPLLTYSGSGTFITAVNAAIDVHDIAMTAPTGKVFDVSETGGGGTKIVLISNVAVNACAEYGTFTKLQSLVISNSNCLDADKGITLDGTTWAILSFIKFALFSSKTDFIGIDLGTAIAPTIEFDNLVLLSPAGSPSTAVGIKGLVDGGNLPAGALGTVTNSSFIGGITPLEGLTSDDIRWSFRGNSANVEDTMPGALLSLSVNATETVISASSTPVKVAGTWVSQCDSHFTADATGRITYNGERPLVISPDVISSVQPASGTNKTLKVFIALNGTEITETGLPLETNTGSPKIMPTMWQLKIQPAEFLEVFASNETDTINVLMSDAIFRL